MMEVFVSLMQEEVDGLRVVEFATSLADCVDLILEQRTGLFQLVRRNCSCFHALATVVTCVDLSAFCGLSFRVLVVIWNKFLQLWHSRLCAHVWPLCVLGRYILMLLLLCCQNDEFGQLMCVDLLSPEWKIRYNDVTTFRDSQVSMISIHNM